MKRFISFAFLALILNVSHAQEVEIIQNASFAAKELGVKCKRLEVAKDACIITYFKEITDEEGILDCSQSKKPADIYRVLLGKTADQRFVLQDFYSSGQKQSDAFNSREKKAILHLAKSKDLKPTQKKAINWHKNGVMASVVGYVDGQYDGHHEAWYENGNKRRKGNYVNGVQNGYWMYWSKSGKKWFEGAYGAMGKPDGRWILWYENGQKYRDGVNASGKKIGLWTDWYENGQKMSESYYLEGELQRSTGWYESGKKRSETIFLDDKQNGKSIDWYENGQKHIETEYTNGEISNIDAWYEDGREVAAKK
jgi:antitoxin component YwqK of YwqJK toxin-antitoxin module